MYRRSFHRLAAPEPRVPLQSSIKRHIRGLEAPQAAAELLTIAFMGAIVFAANALQIPTILFPELSALTSDVLLRPQGKWAKEPWKLIATPTITAVSGTLLCRQFPYGVVSILLAVCFALLVIEVLRSAVSPAISAGVLPIVLGIRSPLYPLCILGTLTALTAILLIWRSIPLASKMAVGSGRDDRVVEVLESHPKSRWWLLSLLLFVAAMGAGAQGSGLRFLLFPPLIVMAYEMLGHTSTCPWAKPPYTFPLACTATAFMGVEAVTWIGPTPAAAVAVLAASFLLLRTLRLRLPPALAIGLIPFIMQKPSLMYAGSVAAGTCALTIWFVAQRFLIRRAIVAS